MTRFARASGSKGSNEKAPEEASSWQDIKKSMLEVTAKSERKVDEVKKEPSNDIEMPSAQEIQTVWADLVAESGVEKKNKKKTSDRKLDTAQVKKQKRKRRDADLQGDSAPEYVSKKKKEMVIDHTVISSENKNINDVHSEAKIKKKKKKMRTALELAADDSTLKKERKKKKDVLEMNRILQCDKTSSKKRLKKKKLKESLTDKAGNASEKNEKSKIDDTTVNIVSSKPIQTPRIKKRRKAELQEIEMMINGRPVKLTPFDGFMILAEDADRLKQLRKSMKEKGIGKVEREKAIKLERRRAEKALQRLKKQVCFHCRGTGHVLSECPRIQNDEGATGICYKCGSTEHSHYQCRVSRGEDFKFAECFICKERGHIAKQCPDNPRGLYPRGGACSMCGDVTHLKKDCPKYVAEQQEEKFTIATRGYGALEALDDNEEQVKTERKSLVSKKKHIRFD